MYDIMSSSLIPHRKVDFILKRALSLILVLASIFGCCAGLFSCKPDDIGPGGTTLENKEKLILDLSDAATITANKLTPSTSQTINDQTQTAEWTLKGGADRSGNKITLNLTETDLSEYKEVTFWMNNTSEENITFLFSFVTGDGTTHSSQASFTDPHDPKDVTTVRTIVAHPGWHQYKFVFSETNTLSDKSYKYDAETGTSTVLLDKSNVKSIVIDASNTAIVTSVVKFYLGSVYANSQKTGTILGYAFPKVENAVCFYEDCNAYLYNQNRYILDMSEKVGVTADGDTTFVPIAILAEHRGATELSATKEKVTFKYNGKSFEYNLGDTVEYVGSDRGFNPGVALSSKLINVGQYLAVPMEVAAEALGYQLFYDQMGLAVFSDIENMYVTSTDSNYKEGEKQLNEIYNLIEVIAFKNYTGAEIIEDMNALHGEDGHTKLIMTQEHFDQMKELIETDPVYASWFSRYESAYAEGTSNYNSKNPYFELSDGYRLLQMSRDVMNELLNYAFLYKMTDNEAYAKKVERTMTSTARFVDNVLTNCRSWHPEHYLDTGELMFGYSIAYDWCYDYLAEDSKTLKTLEDAIWELGYGSAMGFGELFDWWSDPSNLQKYNDEQLAEEDGEVWNRYTAGSSSFPYMTTTKGKFTSTFKFDKYIWTNNWNAVCNGGIGTMALAFANVNDEFRAASEYLLDCVMFSFPAGLFEGYAPDGGYPEGPGYWSYGTTYSVNFIASITSATGSDQGFVNAPGFKESYYFISGVASTAYGTWNYHDAGVGLPDTQLYFWLADFSGDKSIGGLRFNQISSGKSRPGVWDMMWYGVDNYTTDIALKLDYCYYGIDTVTFRSDWTDSALFCGLHGGANAASHGQLDIGNFIVEYGGTRFFNDLGRDEYNLTGYSSNGSVTYFTNPYRYWYYRNRAEGQNTLVINPAYVNTNNGSAGDGGQGTNFDQKYSAVSKILRFESGNSSALAVIDMGCAYRDAATAQTTAGQNVRGMYLTDNRSTVIIQDEMTLTGPSNVLWMGHVVEDGKVTIGEDKKSALIEYQGKTLLCEIVVPEGYSGDFKFEVRSSDYLPETGLIMTPGEYNRDGMQKLVAIAENVSEVKLAVVCRLLSDGPHSYTWTDIKDWQVDR